MKDKETEALKQRLAEMTPAEKIRYFFSYYTPHFLLCVLALVILVSSIVHLIREKKDLLYLGLADISIGSVMEARLTDGFLEASGISPRRNEIILYKDMYLSEDPDMLNHEYAYASQLKLIASVEAGKLDLVLMNREAYDYLSRRGFLYDLSKKLPDSDPDLYRMLLPLLSENEVVLSDNSLDAALGNTDEIRVETETIRNGILANDLPVLREARFPEDVWLGIIANSPRADTVCQYLAYLGTEVSSPDT